MRAYILLTVLVIIACFQLSKANFIQEDELASALLNVDAGGEHGNDSPRLVRQYYGHPFGGYRRGNYGFRPRPRYGYRSGPVDPYYG
ncbi:uncharacterized protein LOC114805265 [Zeugodacus cucurbitae]|uniref:uncharacterized protein LOC114805265 n=1 Tax=Zeugodacus cucurbitae TaxID=28588 RepID=UPI0010A7470A|nr:uncharacterized protein LOC114805265 [Zeugodacus cucurbitae]